MHKKYKLSGYEKINSDLAKALWEKYPNMSDEVYNQEYCDIDGSFLGFVDVYCHLSKIIPLEWTVIDFGCAYNPQAYFFRKHSRYIAVDPGDIKRWNFENGEIYAMDIKTFIEHEFPYMDLDLPTTFAICNAVPARSSQKELLVQTFKNIHLAYLAFTK